MFKVTVLCLLATTVVSLPQYGPPPGSAPGGFVSSSQPTSGPPPGSAPGGIVSSFRPPRPPATSGPPPGSAPGGIVSSFRPQRPPRPSVPSPGSAPGGISSSFGQPIPILSDEREGPDALGNYNFNFETGDGITRYEQGAPQGETGAVASQGGWSFTFPDGTPAVFSFVADELGYRVVSDLLPTPHPLPAHAIAQIEKAEREKAAAAGNLPQHRPAYSSV